MRTEINEVAEPFSKGKIGSTTMQHKRNPAVIEGLASLTSDDRHDYLSLMLAAYAPIKVLGIHFDAATADLALVTQHLEEHAVFALFDNQRMAASVTLRFPWGTLPGPMGLPHIVVRDTPGIQRPESWKMPSGMAGRQYSYPRAESPGLLTRHLHQSSVAARNVHKTGFPAGLRNRSRQGTYHAVPEKDPR